MPGYDHINVVANLGPVEAVRDKEIGDRMRAYPRLLPAGSPDFGYAMQTGTEWRIGSSGASDPAGAQYDLAGQLRRSAAEQDTDPDLARAMRTGGRQARPRGGTEQPGLLLH